MQTAQIEGRSSSLTPFNEPVAPIMYRKHLLNNPTTSYLMLSPAKIIFPRLCDREGKTILCTNHPNILPEEKMLQNSNTTEVISGSADSPTFEFVLASLGIEEK